MKNKLIKFTDLLKRKLHYKVHWWHNGASSLRALKQSQKATWGRGCLSGSWRMARSSKRKKEEMVGILARAKRSWALKRWGQSVGCEQFPAGPEIAGQFWRSTLMTVGMGWRDPDWCSSPVLFRGHDAVLERRLKQNICEHRCNVSFQDSLIPGSCYYYCCLYRE